MSDDDEKTCAHPACDCEVNEETEFCSTLCADSQSSGRCHCTHKDCKAHREPPVPQKRSERSAKRLNKR